MPGTAQKSLVQLEPVLVVHAAPTVVLKHQVNSTAFAQPEGVSVSTPTRLGGVVVREECETTAVPVTLILSL